MIRAHMTFGTNTRILNYPQICHMVTMTTGTGILNHMTTITADLHHLTALLDKSGTLYGRKRLTIPLLMTESTSCFVAQWFIPGTAPTGVQPHTVTTCKMFCVLLSMTTATNLGTYITVTPVHSRMVCTMTIHAIQLPGMRTGQQLTVGRRFFMTGDTGSLAVCGLNRGDANQKYQETEKPHGNNLSRA
jgi:hypothetical protein